MLLDPALLAAIKENPDDDLPRLLAADWLEERGESGRADFIRLQLEIANHPLWYDGKEPAGPKCQCSCCPLQNRERSMLASGKCGNFLDGIHLSYLSLSFVHDTGFPEPVAAYPEVFFLLIRRGFVDAVRCYPDDWAHRGDEILSRQPVRYVDIIQYPEVAGDYRDGMSILILRANDQEVITMPNENPRLNIGGREYEIAARRLMEKRWPNVEIRLPPRSSPIIRPYWDDEPAGANLANAFNALSRYSHESGVGHIGAR